MKTWKEADVIELEIKSTFQNHEGTEVDNWIKGEVPPAGTVLDVGTDYDESGLTATASLHENGTR
ncbi:MAG: hypothetical protein IJL20_01965 [Lachnospiraceae bacterium]|nr:hypothetical protein [Lachnospiraceae bacterium]